MPAHWHEALGGGAIGGQDARATRNSDEGRPTLFSDLPHSAWIEAIVTHSMPAAVASGGRRRRARRSGRHTHSVASSARRAKELPPPPPQHLSHLCIDTKQSLRCRQGARIGNSLFAGARGIRYECATLLISFCLESRASKGKRAQVAFQLG